MHEDVPHIPSLTATPLLTSYYLPTPCPCPWPNTARSASLSTTSTLFNTDKTARHALVHPSSPVFPSLSLSFSRSLSRSAWEDPRPMIDMLGIWIAEMPGRRIE